METHANEFPTHEALVSSMNGAIAVMDGLAVIMGLLNDDTDPVAPSSRLPN